MDKEKLATKIMLHDRKQILKDVKITPKYKNKIEYSDNPTKIIADFTEYSPLHNGHLHCMREAQKLHPDALFVAVVPGPTERSGRGLPFIMTRHARAKSAINAGADIAIEGPPMGIMGSGQYSLCLAKTFQAVDADIIPRGYKPYEGFQEIMDRITMGHGIAPKPYKMVDMLTKEVILEGKLEEDNYVIASLSKSLTKIGFDFKNRFQFVKRIKGVSGTVIRQAIQENNLDMAISMLPQTTVQVLREEIESNNAPLHNTRSETLILETVNTLSKNELLTLALLDETTVNNIIKNKPFTNVDEVKKIINQGFSTHYKTRVLSALEARIDKETISKYIETYPSLIRVLNYKDKHALQEFKDRIPHRRVTLWQ